MLKKMEKAGWINRKRSAQDELVVIISITERGEELQEKAAEVPASFIGRFLRWHINFCPGWKAYFNSLSDRESLVAAADHSHRADCFLPDVP